MDPKEKERIVSRSGSENDYGRKDEMTEQVAAKGRQYGRSGLIAVLGILLLVGVSRNTISSIETGRYSPSLELAFTISDFFGLTIEEIFIWERKDTP